MLYLFTSIIFQLYTMQKNPSSDHEQSMATPKSVRATKKDLHLKKLNLITNYSIENCKTFVVGISGGDCAGKREMTQYMFDKTEDGWSIKDTNEPVTILHQSYFLKSNDGNKYSAAGTDWELFYKQALNLLIGNDVTIIDKKDNKNTPIKLQSAKLLVIEGSHIFMSAEQTNNLSSLINLKVFIDSDSDIRLSRRVYQDVEEKKMDLNLSVAQYLDYIKPSYERQIEPTKQTSDIIIPHFGGGFNDHKKENRHQYDSNIKIACNLILTHLKQEMKKYEEEIAIQITETSTN